MGSYNASTGTWTKGADYSLTETSRNTYRVTGEIPYGDADAIFPTAGNRFAIRIANKNITSKSQLPGGTICKTTNTEAVGGYNKATKSAFEDDGSLIAIFAPTAETKNAYNREVKIEWEGDGVFVTYTFNLTQATLESAPQPQPTGLTPFYDGTDGEHSATIINVGDYLVFDTTFDMDTYLASIVPNANDTVTLCSAEQYPLPEGGEGGAFLMAMNYGGVYMLMANGLPDMMGYSSEAISEQGIPQGWFGLTDGKYEMSNNGIKITGINTTVTGWNGVFAGWEQAN